MIGRWAPTPMDQGALAERRLRPVDWTAKGLPIVEGALTIEELGRQGYDVLAGDLTMPAMVLKRSALEHNIDLMSRFCRDAGVLLAPHAKTTMSPQIIGRQVAAGCWALSCATPTHLRVYRRLGVQRILYANQLVEPRVVRWVGEELARDAAFELYCLVDSAEQVGWMDRMLGDASGAGRVGALVEVGHAGGRAGARTVDDVLEVAAAAQHASRLRLAGLETYEGLIRDADMTAALGRVDELLETVAQALELLEERAMLPDAPLVSAGGSAYFDRVIAAFADGDVRLVLRSGCYVSHDGGYYEEVSPLGARGGTPDRLRSALEVWGAVLSRPEPELAIVGFGKRDLPLDMGLPRIVKAYSPAGGVRDVESHCRVSALSDQHAHVEIDADLPLRPGDLAACEISHPCTAFDKWRLVPLVDDEYRVVDVAETLF
jgi:D-serine dehydratase